MKKRILSVALTFCMLLAVLPTALSVTVLADDALTYTAPNEDVTYIYDKSTHTLTVTGTGTLLGEDVTAAKEVFEKADSSFSLVNLVIGKDVKETHGYPFRGCTSLKEVTVCGDTTFSVYAFENCTGLTSITFLSDAMLADYVFRGCTGLATVVIPGKAEISQQAFSGCTNLESVTVNGDARLGSNAFYNCSKLQNLYVFGGVFYKGSDPFRGFSHALNVYIGASTAKTDYENKFTNRFITVIPLSGTCGATENDSVTWKLSANGTMTIGGTGAMANYYSDNQPWKDIRGLIKKVIVENDVTRVGACAFEDCSNLTSVVFLEGERKKIEAGAFENCSNLTSVTIFGPVDGIGSDAFKGCSSLTSMHAFESINNVGDDSFPGVGALTVYRNAEGNVEGTMVIAGYSYFTYRDLPHRFVVTGGKWGVDYDYDLASGVLTVLTSTALTIANADPATATDHRIVVAGGVDANITLAGVNIDLSNTGNTAFLIENDSTGDVDITLAGGTTNTLKSGSSCAGIQKTGVSTATNEVGTLTIQGTGTLYAIGGNDGAGIGAGNEHGKSTQNIVILGGTIEATGSAAGIGGATGGNASYITIKGGNITAKSSWGAAGIGCGYNGTGSHITIAGGTVTATGGTRGAGIGGGYKGSGGSHITITGGTVTATGRQYGAGIGGGDSSGGSHITIAGGTVTATAGDKGAGIGGGYKGSGSHITIADGTVTATAGDKGAGIGGGYKGSGSNIAISGGKVIATGKQNASGIGGGNSGNGSNIKISGGIVVANGGQRAAGIGGGLACIGSDITISGGTVSATGGFSGAGIGGGDGGEGSNIVISGGSVKVTAGTNGNAIGGGKDKSAVTPTDGEGSDVYLTTISNPDGNAVYFDGRLYTPFNHTAADPTDTNLYVYSKQQNLTAHTVTFNNGTSTTSFCVVGKLGNNIIASPVAPTGHSFDGWYTAQTGGTKFDLNTAVTVDTTLYARFAPNTYTVSYHAGQYGSGSASTGTKTHGEPLTLKNAIFTRTGYTQTGWATSDGGEKVYDLGGSYTANAAVTLYPVWTVNQYTVTVKPENGEADVTITQDFGTPVAAPTLTKDGYEFDGWDKTFPTTMPAEPVTITARWKDITAPTGDITIGTNSWRNFLSHITFGVFFKDTQEVAITATDNSGEAVTVEYLLSDQELAETELANQTFTSYNGPFSVAPNNAYVIYAKLTDTAGNGTYINSNGVVLDNVAPVIAGIEDGKIYCEAQTVTVTESYVDTVTVNGTPVIPDTNGQFTLPPAEVEQKIVVTDKAGNQTEMTVTVNDGHTYEWKNENGQYWQECKFCHDETVKKALPTVVMEAPQEVCRTQACVITLTPVDPIGTADGYYEFALRGTNVPTTETNGVYSATILTDDYGQSETTMTVGFYVTTQDGFLFQIHTAVTIVDEHRGGVADCTHKAQCDICGEEYGEVDAGNHTGTKEWTTKDATQHGQQWNCCGATALAAENHKWNDGVCSDCGYLCNHSGGTPVCNDQACCEVCGKRYGPVDGENHVGHTVWETTATEHEQYWDCCHMPTVEKEAHRWGNGVCTKCGYECTHVDESPKDHVCDACDKAVSAHTGGTADCSHKAVCDYCGGEYGETLAAHHTALMHHEAVAATTQAEGQVEHWQCVACGKCFADADGKTELAAADLVIAKLPQPEEPTKPEESTKTGNTGSVALWAALLFVSGGTVACAAAHGKRKKRAAE